MVFQKLPKFVCGKQFFSVGVDKIALHFIGGWVICVLEGIVCIIVVIVSTTTGITVKDEVPMFAFLI